MSEFESPKLKMAGKLQEDREMPGHGCNVTDFRSPKIIKVLKL